MKGKISLKSQYGQMTQFEIVIPNALPPAQKQSSAGNQFE
jgi:chemotaxis protein histidine kinase CheA